MTPQRLAEIKARADAATAGPWVGIRDAGVDLVNGESLFETGCGCCTGRTLSEANAAFIASSRTDIPDLLAEVERLHDLCASSLDLCKTREATIDRLRKVLERSKIGLGCKTILEHNDAIDAALKE